MTRPPQTSALVIGAGPAGCLAAIRLSREGLDVRMIDRPQRRPPIGETLSPEGRFALSRAGLWQRVPTGVASQCSAIASAWESSSLRSRSFITNPYGSAWHLDRQRFNAWLVSEAISEGVELVTGDARTVARTDEGWLVGVDDGTSYSARYLVVATGRTGAFATKLAPRTRLDSLCVVGGFTEPVEDGGETLLVEAVATGWWYTMPTPDGRYFIGWMTDAASIAVGDRTAIARAAFAETRFTRARVRAPARMVVKCAASAALQCCAGADWIAVGDAGLSRDPLSGDGIAAALRSGWDGAGTILAAYRGEARAWVDAKERNEQIIDHYLKVHASSYSAQPRWSDMPFWAARRAGHVRNGRLMAPHQG